MTLKVNYCPCVLYNCSWKPFTLFLYNPLLSPLWSLSACSQFQCLWLYFACLFILLIRILLKVRSYGICLSPPGLFFYREFFTWTTQHRGWEPEEVGTEGALNPFPVTLLLNKCIFSNPNISCGKGRRKITSSNFIK